MDDGKAKVREFLSRHLRNHDLRDDDDIFALGFVNSLFAMQLVMFVEREFGVGIDNEDLDIKNFRSVNDILELIGRKTASPA